MPAARCGDARPAPPDALTRTSPCWEKGCAHRSAQAAPFDRLARGYARGRPNRTDALPAHRQRRKERRLPGFRRP
ncbi:Hypothetical protein I596_2834 [Dokdonella koreensis DS-123]|uniref:Uncharacterized protein n=1 Tax=Dokdonella koreensis DS-123 TaxID=1300342 RepID=A0A160DW60_9GAMM|nr:Hypothetical protein I596_2834 [Dokdonella koreensis DS-123]